jgi:hypothetical protein
MVGHRLHRRQRRDLDWMRGTGDVAVVVVGRRSTSRRADRVQRRVIADESISPRESALYLPISVAIKWCHLMATDMGRLILARVTDGIFLA